MIVDTETPSTLDYMIVDTETPSNLDYMIVDTETPSNLDYMIVDTETLKNIKYFSVLPHLGLSDECLSVQSTTGGFSEEHTEVDHGLLIEYGPICHIVKLITS